MKRLVCSVFLAMFLLSFGVAHGQQRFSPQEIQAADKVFPILESDLRNYVTAQEAFFVENIRYAGSIRSLAAIGFLYRTSPGVTVIVLTASDGAHSAIAIHEDLPDYPCAIRVGNVPPPLNDEAPEGKATCRWPGTNSQAVTTSGTMRGTIYDPPGEPLANARVVVVGTSLTAVTDENGAYAIDIPAGVYAIRAEFGEYQATQMDGVRIIAGEVLTADFRLREGAG